MATAIETDCKDITKIETGSWYRCMSVNIENLNTNMTTFPNEVSEFCLMECKRDFLS